MTDPGAPPAGARSRDRVLAAPFPREALAQPTLEAARALIGALLVRDAARPGRAGEGTARRVGRIVEVEAYIGEEDRASHARFGRTARNSVMYGPPGVAYVYLVYGMYDCLNVVTEPEGRPAAVLIRAVEPIDGVTGIRDARTRWAAARARSEAARERSAARLAALPSAHLASGPGLVAAAFDISRQDTGVDLLSADSSLRLEVGERARTVAATPRIGIGYADEPWRSHPWRFVDATSPAVSR